MSLDLVRSGALVLVLAGLLASCGSSAPAPGPTGTKAAFDAAGPEFFDLPYPSDLRLTPDGAPDLAKFPNPMLLAIVRDFVAISG